MKKYFFIITLLIVSYTAFMSQNFSVIFSKQETQCQLAQANVSTTSSTNYTVNWSNGSSASSINQLEPGEYSVTVTNSLNNDTTIHYKPQSRAGCFSNTFFVATTAVSELIVKSFITQSNTVNECSVV